MKKTIRVLLSFTILFSQLTAFSPSVAQTGGQTLPWIAITGWEKPLYMVHPDGSGQLQIAAPRSENRTRYANLRWSPDGSFLAYSEIEVETGVASIWLYEVDAGEPRKLIENSHGGFDWYPDGSAILFDKYAQRSVQNYGDVSCPGEYLSTGQYRYDGLYRYDLASNQETPVIAPNSNYPLLNPEFSPDGKYVIFQQHRWDSPLAYYNELPQYVASIASPNRIHELPGTLDDCNWSYDSQTIACGMWNEVCAEADSCPITLFSADGAPKGGLPAADTGFDQHPYWSPVGEGIVFNTSPYRGYADGPCGGFSRPTDMPADSSTVLSSFPNSVRTNISPGRPIGWSPDGSRILLLQGGADVGSAVEVYSVDRDGKDLVYLGEGDQAAWQPESQLVEINSLIDEKQQIVEDLSVFTYTFADVPTKIPGISEAAAQVLLGELREAGGLVPMSQAQAMERLVLQEKTILALQQDYQILSDDYAETQVDFQSIFLAFEFMAIHGFFEGKIGVLSELVLKTIEDLGRLLVYRISSYTNSQTLLDGYEVTLLLIKAKLAEADIIDAGELLLETLSDASIRRSTAEMNAGYWKSWVEPELSQSVQLVRNAQDETVVDSTLAHAELNMEILENLGDVARELGHESYEDFVYARNLNELIKDVADIFTLFKTHPYTIIASVWTRFLQIATDRFAQVKLLNTMTCISEAASNAGDFAFDPEQGVMDCRDYFESWLPVDPFSQVDWVSSDAWGIQEDELTATLDVHQVSLLQLQQQARDGKKIPAEIQESWMDSEQHLVESISNALIMLEPPEIRSHNSTTYAISEQLVLLEARLVGIHLAVYAYQEDPKDDTGKNLLEDAIQRWDASEQEIRETIQNAGEFAAGQPKAVTVIQVPAIIQLRSGKPVQIPVTIFNAGDGTLQGARLFVDQDDARIFDAFPGETAPRSRSDYLIELPIETVQLGELTITIQSNEDVTSRRVFLVLEEAVANTISINIGYMLGGGALFLVGLVICLVALITRSRRKRT